jgi:hypothetical protein
MNQWEQQATRCGGVPGPNHFEDPLGLLALGLRIFGKRVEASDSGCKVIGYRFRGVFYVTDIQPPTLLR